MAEPKQLYSPTSPAADATSEPPVESPHRSETEDRTERAAATSQAKQETPTRPATSEAATSYADINSDEESSANPRLFVGLGFNKVYSLRPNRWIKIGRSKKAQLLLDNSGVSRHHCSIRWDQHRKVVEMRDTSVAGTLLNGETVRSQRRTLQHADKVCVEGKGMRFDFILDLRPINSVLGDPRREQKARMRLKNIVPELKRKRDALRAELTKLDQDVAAKQQVAFTKEAEFYQIMAARRLRIKDNLQKKNELGKFLQATEEMELKLEESREEWFARLQADYVEHDEVSLPIVEGVGNLQVKVDKLQLKRDELLRSIHPERYAVADVSRAGSGIATPSKTQTGSAQDSAGPSREVSEPALSRDRSPARQRTEPAAIENGLFDGLSDDEQPQSSKTEKAIDLDAGEPDFKKQKVEERGV